MFGGTLFPLNRMKKEHPEAYEDQAKKYHGREQLLKKEIPLLKCLWNDVLHLSPIDPQIIVDCWREHDLFNYAVNNLDIEYFQIPIKRLEGMNTVYFKCENYDFNNYDPAMNKFWQFDQQDYQELFIVPDPQIKIWKLDKEAGRKMLWYSHITHVLSKTTIDTTDLVLKRIQ